MRKVILSFILLVTSISVQTQELPRVEFVVNNALEKIVADDKIKGDKFTYHRKYIEENLDDNGNTNPGPKIQIYRIEFTNGSFLEELIEENGKPTTRNGLQPPKDRVDIKAALGEERYSFRLDGLSTYRPEGQKERIVYSVRFEPRRQENQPKGDGLNTREKISNQLFNNLHGTLFIDKETFTLWRIEAHLNKPPMTIMNIARVYEFDSIIEQQEIDGISVGHKLTLIYRYGRFFALFQVHQKITVTFENYTSK